MQTILRHTKGLSLLMNVNTDRLVFIMAVMGALWAGAWVGSMPGF